MHLDPDAAEFVRSRLAEHALRLRADASAAMKNACAARGQRQRMFEYIHDSLVEAAIALEKSQACVNPNKERG